jgi:hypothetical protein
MLPEVGVTVAVKVTEFKRKTGLAFEASVVAVGCVLMTLTVAHACDEL